MQRLVQALGHLDKLPELIRCARRIQNPVALFVRFFDLPGASYPVEIHARDGRRYVLREFCDALTVWEMYCREQYRVPAGARRIIDIGANIGVFTAWAAKHAPNARVVSVEPFPRTFDRLLETVHAHGFENRVVCLRKGLALAAGERAMSAAETGSSGRSLLPAGDRSEGAVRVRATTLAELIRIAQDGDERNRIDLVKMDIEGAEHEVIPALSPEEWTAVDAVQIEYHPNGSRRALFAALRRAGFVLERDARVEENLGVAHFARPGVRKASHAAARASAASLPRSPR